MITHIFVSTVELPMSTGTPNNEANVEIETQPVIGEGKISKCSTYFKYLHVFLCFYLIKSLCFVSSKILLVSSIFSV